MIKHLLFVGLGGAIGSILRYLSAVLINKFWIFAFPWATFFVNILGCILIGFFIGLGERNSLINGDVKLFLITGFCGGFTTFSTFSFENMILFQNGYYLTTALYVVSSVLIGFFGIWIGGMLARLV